MGAYQLVEGSLVAALVHLVFIVDGVQLSLGRAFWEQRIFEELWENVKSFSVLVGLDVEEVGHPIFSSHGIIHATSLLDELVVVILLRIFFGAQKQHMLTKVCKSIYWVSIASNSDCESSKAFLSWGILNNYAL